MLCSEDITDEARPMRRLISVAIRGQQTSQVDEAVHAVYCSSPVYNMHPKLYCKVLGKKYV